jgi:HEAT repeat protein
LAVEPLVKLLRESNEQVRITIIETLGELKDPRAIEPLTDLLSDANEDIRVKTIEALGNIEDEHIVPVILRSINDQSYIVRAKAAKILGDKRDERALESLYKLLDDPNNKVREEAVEALGKIGDASAVLPLVKAVGKENMWIKNKIFEAVNGFGDAALPTLIKLLKHTEETIRNNATEILSVLDNSQIEKLLIKMLKDRNKFITYGFMQKCGNNRTVHSSADSTQYFALAYHLSYLCYLLFCKRAHIPCCFTSANLFCKISKKSFTLL